MVSGSGHRHPNTVAIALDRRNHKVAAVYNDHSLYVWDVRDIKKVGKMRSSLYHSGCIWGLDVSIVYFRFMFQSFSRPF